MEKMKMTKIKAERALRGITLEDLAKGIGVHKMTVFRWEHGETVPSYSMLCKVANFFGCTVDWLIGRTESRK